MHALIENGAVKQYPYGVAQLKRANKNVSLPKNPSDEVLASFNVLRVFNATPPKSDKDVAEMQARLDAMAAEIAALQAKDRTPEEEEQLQAMVTGHAAETQILQSLPTPYAVMASVLEEATPVFADQRWTQVWTVRDLTAQEIASRDEGQAASVRAERDSLLVATDWRFRSDMNPSQEWVDYCQQLRDITAQAGFPWTVQWPTQPEM